MRDGRDNDPAFGSRMTGAGPYADLLRTRFRAALKRHGLYGATFPPLRTDRFRPPRGVQLALL